MATRTFKIIIEGDETDGVKAVKKTEDAVDGLRGKVSRHFGAIKDSAISAGKTIATGLGVAAVGGAVALAKGLSDAVTAARESVKIGKQTEQVIKTMGASSWTSSKRVGDLAGRLSNLTGVDDELIQSGANLVLTFGNIRNAAGKGNNIFDRTVSLANDMSVALGQDMSASSIQLGKALNDPVKGITALQRVGVSFTQGQRDQIAAMVEAGDVLGAQKTILAEVERQFGGTAAAVATPWERLKVTFGNIQEELGARLLPLIDRTASWLADRLPGAIDTVTGAFSEFWTALTTGMTQNEGGTWWENLALKMHPVVEVLPRIVDWIDRAVGAVSRFAQANPAAAWTVLGTILGGIVLAGIAGVVAAIAGVVSTFMVVVGVVALLAGGLVYAYNRFEGFRNVVDTVVSWIRDTAVPWLQNLWSSVWEGAQRAYAIAAPIVMNIVTFVSEQFSNLVQWVRDNWESIREAIGHVIVVIQTIIVVAIGAIVLAWRLFGDDLVKFAGEAWDFIKSIVGAAINIVSGVIRFVLAIINGDWSAAWDAMKQFLAGIWDAITALVRLALSAIQLIIGAAWQLIQTGASLAWGAIWSTISFVWETIKAGVGAAVDWVADKVGGAWDAISEKAGRVWGGIAAAVGGAWELIKAGVRNGANAAIGVVNRLISGVNRILSWIPGVSDSVIPEIPTIGGGGGGGTSSGDDHRSARHMASGGSVPPFMTNGVRAIVGEGRRQYPEFVIPSDPQYGQRARGLWAAAGHRLGIPGFARGGVPGAGAVGAAMGAVGGAVGGIGDALSCGADMLRRGALMAIFGPIAAAADAAIDRIPWALPRGLARLVKNKFYNFVTAKDAERDARMDQADSGGTTRNSARGGGVKPRGPGIYGLYDPLARVVSQIIAEGGGRIGGWGWRSSARQAEMYYDWIHGLNGQARAAPPGRSKHERGAAVDFNGDRGLYTRLARAHGLIRTVPGEAWHWEYPGFRMGGRMPVKAFHRGGVLREDVTGIGRSGTRYALQAGETITRRGAGGTVVDVHEGAVVIHLAPGDTGPDAERKGRAAARGFLDVLEERRILANARVR